MEKDYRLIFVGNTQVGLIGLEEIFRELKNQKEKPEPQLKEMKYGILSPPALIINGKVKSKGTIVPSLPNR